MRWPDDRISYSRALCGVEILNYQPVDRGPLGILVDLQRPLLREYRVKRVPDGCRVIGGFPGWCTVWRFVPPASGAHGPVRLVAYSCPRSIMPYRRRKGDRLPDAYVKAPNDDQKTNVRPGSSGLNMRIHLIAGNLARSDPNGPRRGRRMSGGRCTGRNCPDNPFGIWSKFTCSCSHLC